MKSNIKKWGSSLALRLPASVLDGTVFELDLEVDVRVEGNRMIIEPVRPGRYARGNHPRE
ncbi:Antitoxin MazE [compost metagenome]